MTGDARGEAEEIVDRLSVLFGDFQKPRPDDEHIPDLVVAALAAAIEVVEARMDNYAQKARPVEEAMQRNIETHEELERAVFALRARAGEGTDGR